MAEKKETKAKAKPKAKREAAKEAAPTRPAKLTLRDSYGVTMLENDLVMFGNPQGLQMLGRGHRVTGNFENLIMLESTCENREETAKLYTENGWKLSK